MRRALGQFCLAVEFLTIVRLQSTSDDPRSIGGSLAWFPLVGLIIGLLLLIVDRAAASLFPVTVEVALVLAVNAIVTGALHLDGLADAADGLFGGHDPEQRLAIMRDSRIGSFGVVAVTLALLLSFAALVSMSGLVRSAMLASAPVLSRFAMVVALAAFPYARPAGLGRAFKESMPRVALPTAAVLALVLSALGLGFAAPLFLLAAVAIALLVGGFASRRLGGLTGDLYGTVGVLTELTLFLIAATDSEHGWLSRWLTW